MSSHLVASEDGRVGELTLWMDADAARAAMGPNSTAESFDVPILAPAGGGARRVAGAGR